MINTKEPYVIAEIGANHNGDLNLAKKMIKIAKEAGADAVKFQIKMDPFELSTEKHSKDLDEGKVKLENVDEWRSKELGLNNIWEQQKKFNFSKEEYAELAKYAQKFNIDFGASVFTTHGVEFLQEINADFIKLASMDANNYKLIEHVLDTDMQLILSTGMTSLSEIDVVYNMIPEDKIKDVSFLHCVSLYPPKDEFVNLNFIRTLNNLYNTKIGYSDHSIGTSIPVSAVALGAIIIEKHFTLDKNMPGWDHKVSANPEELSYICKESKRVFDALGVTYKKLSKEEIEKRKKFRRSITTINELNAGDKIELDNITFKRPGNGIPVSDVEKVIGLKVNKNIKEDSTIYWEDIR